MRKKKSFLGNVIKGAGLIALAAGATYGGIMLKKSLDKNNISVKIKAIAKDLEEFSSAEIDFKDIIKEEWFTMHIFEPYTSYNDIFDSLGFEWDEVYKTSISYRDDMTLLVFSDGTKVVNYVEFPKEYGDFSSLEKTEYTDGSFELVKVDDKITVREF